MMMRAHLPRASDALILGCVFVLCMSNSFVYGNEEEVKDVVAFAKNQAEVSLPKARNLVQALQTGNMEEAKAAYLALRPRYEAIEHLFLVFGDTDADIDARTYNYVHGEAYDPELIDVPGAIFKGSHRIEYLIFRDEDLESAIVWAKQLVKDYETLVSKLEDSSNYSEEIIFRGITELAYEVAKKKFSSEEETFSDLSILIFYHNLEGIIEMVAPWQVQLQETSPEVADRLQKALDKANNTLNALVERDQDGNIVEYAPYSSVDITTRRKIQNEFYEVGQALEEAATALGIDISAAEEEDDSCEPTIETTVYDANSPQIRQGLEYFSAMMPYALNASAAFTRAVEEKNLTAAKDAYLATRPIYEQIEVLAVSFPEIDEALDAREYNYFRGELDENWKGYHRVERHIFSDGKITEETLDYARGIEESLKELDELLKNPDENFNAANTFDGVASLATEVPTKKISSEEETSSDLSLLIFYNNWKGILSQVYPFCEDAAAECENVIAAVEDAVSCLDIDVDDDVKNVMASQVTPESMQNLLNGDYNLYSNTSNASKKCIVEKGYAVRDAVVEMGNALQIFDDCSPFYPENFLVFAV